MKVQCHSHLRTKTFYLYTFKFLNFFNTLKACNLKSSLDRFRPKLKTSLRTIFIFLVLLFLSQFYTVRIPLRSDSPKVSTNELASPTENNRAFAVQLMKAPLQRSLAAPQLNSSIRALGALQSSSFGKLPTLTTKTRKSMGSNGAGTATYDPNSGADWLVGLKPRSAADRLLTEESLPWAEIRAGSELSAQELSTGTTRRPLATKKRSVRPEEISAEAQPAFEEGLDLQLIRAKVPSSALLDSGGSAAFRRTSLSPRGPASRHTQHRELTWTQTRVYKTFTKLVSIIKAKVRRLAAPQAETDQLQWILKFYQANQRLLVEGYNRRDRLSFKNARRKQLLERLAQFGLVGPVKDALFQNYLKLKKQLDQEEVKVLPYCGNQGTEKEYVSLDRMKQAFVRCLQSSNSSILRAKLSLLIQLVDIQALPRELRLDVISTLYLRN